MQGRAGLQRCRFVSIIGKHSGAGGTWGRPGVQATWVSGVSESSRGPPRESRVASPHRQGKAGDTGTGRPDGRWAEAQRGRAPAKSRGGQVSRAGGSPDGRTETRLRVVARDVSGRHQLDPPPSSPPPPSERRRSHCAAGAEGSRPVLGAGHPAPRRSVGLSEPRAVLQQRTEGRSVPGEPTVSVYCSGLKIRTEFSYHFSLPSRRGHIGLNPEQMTRLSSLRI